MSFCDELLVTIDLVDAGSDRWGLQVSEVLWHAGRVEAAIYDDRTFDGSGDAPVVG